MPALDAVGNWSTLIVIASVLGTHVPFVMVHTNVFTPLINPVTPEFGSSGSVTVAVPAVTVHVPVPTVGVFAASVAVGLQIV